MRSTKTIRGRKEEILVFIESLLTLSVWTEKEKIVEILDILKRKNKSWEMCHWKRRFQETANN